jgi:glycosyltransferase involved in cell wall biosynthesis
MKLLFLIRSLGMGGAERQLVNLSGALKERGHDVTVCVYYPGGEFEAELVSSGVRLEVIKKRGRADVFGFLMRLVRFVRDERPDAIHSYLTVPNAFTALIKPFIGKTKLVWGVRASNMELQNYGLPDVIASRAEALLSGRADLIITNSRAGLEHAAGKGFPQDRMRIVNNGIDTERFRPDPDARKRVRNAWGVPDRSVLVGIAARLDPMKDHETFVKAAAGLASRLDDVFFVCVGGGSGQYAARLRELSDSLGLAERMIWAGQRDNMPSVYNAFDVCVLSSVFGEGFPNSVAEAMACGVPCVVTDVGDAALLVGRTGVVVPPGNPELLFEGIAEMIRKIGSGERIQTRERVEKEFSLDALAANTMKMFSGLYIEGGDPI